MTHGLDQRPRLLALAGSLRGASFNQKLLHCAVLVARAQGAEVDVVDLKQQPLPFFDGDLESEAGLPPEVETFRARVFACEGIILATPEYNRGISAVLKNAVDWASRRRPTQAWEGKPVLLLGATPGKRAAANALAQLAALMTTLRAKVLEDPLGLAKAADAFDAHGALRDPAVQAALEQRVQGLLQRVADDRAAAKAATEGSIATATEAAAD